MGSGASKSAAQSTIRKFPNRAPGSAPPPSSSSNAAGADQTFSRIRAAHKAYGERAAAAAERDFNLEDPTQRQGQPSRASLSKDEAIQKDGYDPQQDLRDATIQPDLAKRLREIGVVQPNPTFSPSSTANVGPNLAATSQNTVLSALEARQRIQEEADEDFQRLGTPSSEGRRFMHAGMIRDVLVMRDRGASDAQIESKFALKKGVLQSLGPPALYKPTGVGAHDAFIA